MVFTLNARIRRHSARRFAAAPGAMDPSRGVQRPHDGDIDWLREASTTALGTDASSPSAFLAALHRSAMDVRETPDALVFVADVPGTKREDVEVEVDEADRTLTVRGRREETVEVGEDQAEEAKEEKKNEEREIQFFIIIIIIEVEGV